jgi:hypothetical protein
MLLRLGKLLRLNLPGGEGAYKEDEHHGQG